jgi:hypothetical protein
MYVKFKISMHVFAQMPRANNDQLPDWVCEGEIDIDKY